MFNFLLSLICLVGAFLSWRTGSHLIQAATIVLGVFVIVSAVRELRRS